MREIKYLVWDKEWEMMCPVENIEYNRDLTIKGVHYFMEDGIAQLREPDKFILREYTGLKDKNGKEIYNKDIVVKKGYIWFDRGEPNYRGIVEWIYSQWQVVAHCVNPKKRGISEGVNEGFNDDGVDEGGRTDWEVIGNIYENPELLP